MQTHIVYLDESDHARRQLASLRGAAAAPRPLPAHFVLVACAPRMTHRVSKWVSHSARENWRAKWADRLFDGVVPWLESGGHRVTPVLARGPLPELTRKLLAEHDGARVLDARRPREVPPPDAPRPRGPTGSMLGLGLALVVAGD